MWFVESKNSSLFEDISGVKVYCKIKGYKHSSSYKIPSYFDIKILYCILHSFQNSTVQDRLSFSHLDILDFCYIEHTTHNKRKVEDSLKIWFGVSVEIDNFVNYVMGENRKYEKFNKKVLIDRVISDYSIEKKNIEVKINPLFLRLLSDSDSFALLDLDYCFLFKHAFLFRLYEILSKEMYKAKIYKVPLREFVCRMGLSGKSDKVVIDEISKSLRYLNELNRKLIEINVVNHNLLYFYKCSHYSVVKKKHILFERKILQKKKTTNIYRGDDDRTQDLLDWVADSKKIQ